MKNYCGYFLVNSCKNGLLFCSYIWSHWSRARLDLSLADNQKTRNNLTNDSLETWLCTGVCPYLPTNVCTYIRMYEPTYIPWVSIPTYPCMCLLTYVYWCMIWKINGLTLAFWLFILLDQKNDVSRIRAQICGVGRRTTWAHPRPKFIQTSNASSSRRTIFPLNFWQQVCTLSILKCHQKSLQQAL